MAGKKNGGGLMEGLWAGTAFFAAANAKTYVDFLGKYFLYALVLIVVAMLIAWVIRTVTGKEMFSVAEIKCPPGSSPGKCPGTDTDGCVTASGNCTASLNQ